MAEVLTETNNKQHVQPSSRVESDHQNNLIAEFCSITGAQTKAARSFLGASSWNIVIALSQFFECNGDESKLQHPNNQLSDSKLSAIAEFCSITGADTSVAEAFLGAVSWEISTATNRFFELNGDASKLMPQSVQQDDIGAIAGSLNTLCFCKSPLRRYDGIMESAGYVCTSCWKPIREIRYRCSNGQNCIFEAIHPEPYHICWECYNLLNEDSPENEIETNSNEFVCKKVKISLTKIS